MRGDATAIDWEGYREEFPAAANWTYLDHAAVSPLSTRVAEAMDALSRTLASDGVMGEEEIFARVDAARALAGGLIGASPDEIAFTKNTTQGVLLAAGGIRWRGGDNIVMPGIEFPANVYPWLALRDRGVEVRMVQPEDGRVTAGMLEEACDGRTRAVSVSLVQFVNGYRIDAARLSRFCRERGIVLHADGIQALGMIRCDVRELGVDMLSAGSHKWLLGPPGIGIFYCRRDLIEDLEVWNPGWAGVENPWEFLDYSLLFQAGARRFEEGTLNLHGVFGLGAALERFHEIGMDRIEDRILALAGTLQARLEGAGYRIASPRGEHERSGILCFDHADRPAEEIHASLRGSRVVTSLRSGAVRLSPHFYNNDEDIERVMDSLTGR